MNTFSLFGVDIQTCDLQKSFLIYQNEELLWLLSLRAYLGGGGGLKMDINLFRADFQDQDGKG